MDKKYTLRNEVLDSKVSTGREKKRSYNSCIIEIDLDCDTLESGGINETKIDLYRININSKVIKCKRIERIGKLNENIMHDKGVIGSNPQSIRMLLDPLHSVRRKRFINFEIALNFIQRISLNYLV